MRSPVAPEAQEPERAERSAGDRLPGWTGWLASISVAAAFVESVLVFFNLLGLGEHDRHATVHWFEWIAAGLGLALKPCTDLLQAINGGAVKALWAAGELFEKAAERAVASSAPRSVSGRRRRVRLAPLQAGRRVGRAHLARSARRPALPGPDRLARDSGQHRADDGAPPHAHSRTEGRRRVPNLRPAARARDRAAAGRRRARQSA